MKERLSLTGATLWEPRIKWAPRAYTRVKLISTNSQRNIFWIISFKIMIYILCIVCARNFPWKFPIRRIFKVLINFQSCHPGGSYMFKINNRNNKTSVKYSRISIRRTHYKADMSIRPTVNLGTERFPGQTLIR